jgi:hypothetical protein
MKAFCIPKNLAANLKEAAKRGDIKIEDLYNMDSKGRKAVFEKYTDAETAQNINSGFEESIVSAQKDSLKKWAENTFVGKEKNSKEYKDVLDKISQLDELGVLDPNESNSFLEDMVATRLGASVTAEEVNKIVEMTKNLETIEQENPTNEFGQPSLEYLKARKEINDYIASLTPSSELSLISSTIARGNLLTSPKTITTNIVGNSVLGALEAAQRRIRTGIVSGANNDLALKYVKEQAKIYKETEFDLSRMVAMELSPTVLGEKQLTSQGKGPIRKLARFYEDTIFKYGLGLPDAVYSATAFADSVNLNTTKIARSEGLKGTELQARAKEIFLDATKLEPTTETGQKVRNQAIADAMYSTLTNKSVFTNLSSGIRNVLNDAVPDIRLGDQLIPFAKTPANVIGTGLDYSGLGFVKAAMKFKSAWEDAKHGNFEKMDQVKTDMTRSGLGLTLGFILMSLLKVDDYQGEYPSGLGAGPDKALYNLENTNANSIKIGDKWISLDYFGPLAPFMTGMFNAKKYGDENLSNKAFKLGQSYLSTAFKIPGVDSADSVIQFFKDNQPEGNNTVSSVESDAIRAAVDFVSARAIPAIIKDIAKISDTVERKASYDDPLSSFKAGIPGLRQQLPAKIDIFGKPVSVEAPLSVILFGSRMKTAQQDEIITEFNRLQAANSLPTLADPETTSTKVGNFKGQVPPEVYDKALSEFRSQLKTEYYKVINSSVYKKATDEDKKDLINGKRLDVLDSILAKYHYKKPKK